MEIGLFQLENLLSIRHQFIFLDLRGENSPWPEKLKTQLQSATPVKAENLQSYLEKEKIKKDHPVILICETGKTSAAQAHALEIAGYSNIYIVADGVVGLLSEL